MKFHKSSFAVMILACILLVTVTMAKAEQPSPARFYGQVKINGANVPDGTKVSAWINGVRYAETDTSTHEGHSVYSLDVPGDDPATPDVIEGGVEGDTIVFTIGDLELEAEQTGTWTSANDENLDLSVMVVTVTADPQTKVYGEPDPELTYAYAPDDPEIIFNGALDREEGERVGNFAITPGDLVAEGYTIVFISDDLTITPKPITLTAEPKSKIYRTVDPPLTFTPSQDLVDGDIFDGKLARISGENAGLYLIEQGTLRIEDGNEGANYTVTYESANLTIEPRPITVTADYIQKVLGEVDPPLTYQTTSGELIPPDTFAGALARESGEAIGTYEILIGDLSIEDENQGKNYDLTFQEGIFTINPITITSVAVTDIQEPVAEGSPDLLAIITAIPSAGIAAPTAEVTWDPEDDPFEYATLYTAGVTLTAAEGYAFSESTTATVNGNDANILLNLDGTLTVHYEFTTAGYNSPPIADDQTVITLKDTPVEITLTASDPDGDPLSFNIIKLSNYGGLSGTPPNVLYTPLAGFVGTDFFTFTVHDGKLFSNTATVTIHVHEPACLQVGPADLMQTQQADISSQLFLTLTNTCSVEVEFDLMESVIEIPLLSEGFEDNFMPPIGWESQQLNENHTWRIVTNPVDQGQFAAWVRYDLDHPSDEWLITPVLDTATVMDLVLSFRAYSRTDFPGASMKVWVLDVDGDPLSDEPLWDMIRDEHWPDATYRSVLVDLGEFDGYGEIRIGWQYIGKGGDSFYLDTIYVGSRSEISWLDFRITSGIIAAGESREIAMTFDSSGMDLGTYQGLLSLTNFPYPMINVPVSLRVIGEEHPVYLPLIFR